METIEISIQTARRFVLGRQGLWPGRRWAGKQGTEQALRTVEAVQMDPLNVVARSHHIVLWSRVADYKEEYLNELLYEDRQFFDYGGALFIYPMSELLYWRTSMKNKGLSDRWSKFAEENRDVIEQVREELRKRGPVGNRDFKGNVRLTNNYRGRKDTALALYYLWLTGEVMIDHRKGFDRFYDFRNKVAPSDFDKAAPEKEAVDYFVRKIIAFAGIARDRGFKWNMNGFLERAVSHEEADERLANMLDEGVIAPVRILGSKERWYVLNEDAAILTQLEDGSIPEAWQPVGATTGEEVVFLAPLDIVSARGRSAWLFDFEYIWEVYKPASARRWGYYTLPILYGDRLVARLDPKLDRKTGTLTINGFWLEDPSGAADESFADALAMGMANFAQFLEAQRLDITAIQHPLICDKIQERFQAREILIEQKS